MPTITLEVSDELYNSLKQAGDRLPDILTHSLHQPPLPAQAYKYVLDFLASDPTPRQIQAFRPTEEMVARWQALIARSKQGTLTAQEQAEIEAYERIEHLVVMMKAGTLPYLSNHN